MGQKASALTWTNSSIEDLAKAWAKVNPRKYTHFLDQCFDVY